MVPEKKIAFSKKVAKFHIFFSEKNFQDRFFSEKTEIALPHCKWALEIVQNMQIILVLF